MPITFHLGLFLLLRRRRRLRLLSSEKIPTRENEQAIVADWPIEKRLSSRDAFFLLVLLVDWRKINDSERERIRETERNRESQTHTHTAGR